MNKLGKLGIYYFFLVIEIGMVRNWFYLKVVVLFLNVWCEGIRKLENKYMDW